MRQQILLNQLLIGLIISHWKGQQYQRLFIESFCLDSLSAWRNGSISRSGQASRIWTDLYSGLGDQLCGQIECAVLRNLAVDPILSLYVFYPEIMRVTLQIYAGDLVRAYRLAVVEALSIVALNFLEQRNLFFRLHAFSDDGQPKLLGH